MVVSDNSAYHSGRISGLILVEEKKERQFLDYVIA
jgi:hypothetical protein